MTVCLNGAKEICGLHLGGNAELTTSFILSAVMKATSRVSTIIEQIKKSVKIDHELRLTNYNYIENCGNYRIVLGKKKVLLVLTF